MAADIIGPEPPINGLIQDTPANTIERCRGVINWLAHIEQPFTGGELAAAEADVLHFVSDALEHAEKAFRTRYRIDDDSEPQELAREAGRG
jgi:hypothetical protein